MNSFLWVLLAVLALVLSWFAESTALAWFAVLLVLVLLLSRLLVRLMPRVEATRTLSTTYAYPGERTRVWVRVRLSRRPWGWLSVGDLSPPLPILGNRGTLVAPAGDCQAEFGYSLDAKRRGYFTVGPLVAHYGDPLGFAQSRRVLVEADAFTVFPRVVPMGRARVPLARAPGELRSLRRTFEDPTRPAGIREYRRGDALRRIHWRATAHTGSPQAKLYDVSTSLQALIVLNLHRPDYATAPDEALRDSELAISLAASLAVYLLSAGQRVGIVSNGIDVKDRDKAADIATAVVPPAGAGGGLAETPSPRLAVLPPGYTPDRQFEILSLLARLQPAAGIPLSAAMADVRRHLTWGEAVIVITPSADASAVEQLLVLNHAGFSAVPLVVGDTLQSVRAHLMLTAATLGPHRITSEEDIRGLFS